MSFEKQEKIFKRFEKCTQETQNKIKEIEAILDKSEGRKNQDNDVPRVKAFLEEGDPNMHANMRALAYGETMLNRAIGHSFDMTKMLLEHHGAKVNQGDMMDSQTPMDHIKEMEEYRELRGDLKRIKDLLVEHGAKRSSMDILMNTADDEERGASWEALMHGDELDTSDEEDGHSDTDSMDSKE
jgi:hypothetical protein